MTLEEFEEMSASMREDASRGWDRHFVSPVTYRAIQEASWWPDDLPEQFVCSAAIRDFQIGVED